jgi:LPPG:FO 2-phospho-L-lactate transferase
MPFQNYCVEKQCGPAVRGVAFAGAEEAAVQTELAAALCRRDLRAVIICPSNPYLSIDPILAIPGMRTLLSQAAAPVVAVSPVVGGKAVKGPMAKIMRELAHEVSHATIANHYDGLIDGLMVDCADAGIPADLTVAVRSTMMESLEDKIGLARAALAFADDIAARQLALQEQRA